LDNWYLGEVSRIRGRISAFDTIIIQYREAFKRYEFFKYDCKKSYIYLDEAHKEISMLERQMHDIQESASLFEVIVPEFKQLKQCRKELKMLKQLWDYVNIVRSSIEGWKITPWRKIDVENMDIECKKFSKDIRGKVFL
jgi:dynein heavy chain